MEGGEDDVCSAQLYNRKVEYRNLSRIAVDLRLGAGEATLLDQNSETNRLVSVLEPKLVYSMRKESKTRSVLP